MNPILHITSGDCSGGNLAKSGINGEVFVWHDLLYEGPRNPGWPDESTLAARTEFLHEATGGGLSKDEIERTFRAQYRKLEQSNQHAEIVLWFDACLFDMAMLAHILACLRIQGRTERVQLLCVDEFPGIHPYDGIGQLSPEQLASLSGKWRSVSAEQFEFASTVDRAFAVQDMAQLCLLAGMTSAPLPWVPAAAARWVREQPDPATGLSLLEKFALDAIQSGCETPRQIYEAVAARDSHPRYWGDITLWGKVNRLANRTPSLVTITGPDSRLPQWEGVHDLEQFRIRERKE